MLEKDGFCGFDAIIEHAEVKNSVKSKPRGVIARFFFQKIGMDEDHLLTRKGVGVGSNPQTYARKRQILWVGRDY